MIVIHPTTSDYLVEAVQRDYNTAAEQVRLADIATGRPWWVRALHTMRQRLFAQDHASGPPPHFSTDRQRVW